MKKILLSKSKIKDMNGCDLMLWNSLNLPQEDKQWSKDNLYRFEQGRQVEQFARDLFPTGVLQNKVRNTEKAEMTQDLLKTASVIFEAAFVSNQTIIQFDILSKNEDGTYDAVEVKSASKFKPEYEIDVLIQYWIATLAGIKINKFELWFVNKNATKIGENYFVRQDITDLAKNSEERFWELLNKALTIAMTTEAPVVKTGAHCERLECPYRGTEKCAMSKAKDSVFSLPRFPAAWAAVEKGITTVNDPRFDQTYKYTESNPLIIQSIREDKLIINREELMKDYSAWKFPLNFFDFETLMGAIPVMDGQRPYEQMTFQFSNHVFDGQNNQMKHSLHLHTDTSSPHLPMVLAILNTLEANEGSVVAYNKTFEQTRIRDLANKFPEYSDRLLAIVERFVDLMDLVKDHVYHPDFMGSYSLKVVSPTLLKEYGAYTDSLIKSGSEIAQYYTEMITTENLERKQLIYNALDKYCFYDTLNLFLVLQFLIDPKADIAQLVELNLGQKK